MTIKNFQNKKGQRGQTSLEYTVLVIVVMAALMTVGSYFKRGLQGKWKSTVDGLGDQYDPLYGNTYISHELQTNAKTTILAVGDATNGWWTSREDLVNTIETKDGHISSGSY